MAEDPFPDLTMNPKLRLHMHDLTHDATTSFLTLVDCKRLVPNAVKHIVNTLYTPYGLESVPSVRSVTIILREMDGVAYTTGIELDDMHKEIHVSLDYLGRMCNDPPRFRDEAIGVMTHEMVHCFQHNCKGTAPGGLVEGMADFVRLKAGLAPPHWKKTKNSMGEKWDEGYQKTAWFLEWLEKHRGAGIVSKMNETMGKFEYDEDTFWPELFGEKIDVLWERYQSTWNDDESILESEEEAEEGNEEGNGEEGEEGGENPDEDADGREADEQDQSDPEMVDLDAAGKEEAKNALHPKKWKA